MHIHAMKDRMLSRQVTEQARQQQVREIVRERARKRLFTLMARVPTASTAMEIEKLRTWLSAHDSESSVATADNNRGTNTKGQDESTETAYPTIPFPHTLESPGAFHAAQMGEYWRKQVCVYVCERRYLYVYKGMQICLNVYISLQIQAKLGSRMKHPQVSSYPASIMHSHFRYG